MIGLIITLAFVSLLVWIVVTYIAKIEPIRTIIIAVAALCMLIYIMNVFGFVDIPLPRVR